MKQLWVSGLIFWVSGLIFWVSEPIFWVSGLIFWVSGPAGGRAAQTPSNIAPTHSSQALHVTCKAMWTFERKIYRVTKIILFEETYDFSKPLY